MAHGRIGVRQRISRDRARARVREAPALLSLAPAYRSRHRTAPAGQDHRRQGYQGACASPARPRRAASSARSRRQPTARSRPEARKYLRAAVVALRPYMRSAFVASIIWAVMRTRCRRPCARFLPAHSARPVRGRPASRRPHALVGEARIARDDEQPFDARQSGDDVFDHPVGEILLLRIAAQIGERQAPRRTACPARPAASVGGDATAGRITRRDRRADIAIAATRQRLDPIRAAGASSKARRNAAI